MIDKMLHDPFLLACGGLFIVVALFMLVQKLRNRD
jgi:hypothetical protein